jgi:hypothetical protein
MCLADSRERPALPSTLPGFEPWPGRVNLKTGKENAMSQQKLKLQPLKYNHRVMLKRRGINPDNYLLIKSTYSSLYLRDIRDGSVRIIYKNN